jgi:hypothetical protein
VLHDGRHLCFIHKHFGAYNPYCIPNSFVICMLDSSILVYNVCDQTWCLQNPYLLYNPPLYVRYISFSTTVLFTCTAFINTQMANAGFLSHSDSGEESDWPCEVVSLTLDSMLPESWQVYSSDRVNWLCLGWQCVLNNDK